MTDGTTGIQVAPITEDDMSRVKSILQRAADAIVGASQMANDIAAMRVELVASADEAASILDAALISDACVASAAAPASAIRAAAVRAALRASAAAAASVVDTELISDA